MRNVRHALAAGLVLVAGCSQIIGIGSDPTASACVMDTDCGADEVCRDFACVSACTGGSCADGGMGGEGASDMTGGKGGREPNPLVGAGKDGSGGTSGGASGKGGDDNPGGAPQGGEVGKPKGGRGGDAGIGGVAGDGLGGAGDGGAGDGGTTGGGCDSQCVACEDGKPSTKTLLSCKEACTEDKGCTLAPSCNGLEFKCGPNDSCCLSIPMLGDDFSRSCDYCSCGNPDATPYPATVGSFSLDAYEVTVGRMHRFLSAYENGWRPEAGDGKNPRNEEDTGWLEDWSASLPATAQELSDSLGSSSCSYATWTPYPNENGTLPINCVSWFVAQAFCIWDRGRLPTEAEWNYAAGNGKEARAYPWSVPSDSQTISDEYAVYAVDGVVVGPDVVGGKTKGRGVFGQYDLAGNVAEWTFDAFSICYLAPDQCNDCGDPVSDDGQRVTRGGSFINFPEDLMLTVRSSGLDVNGAAYTGFRCARDP